MIAVSGEKSTDFPSPSSSIDSYSCIWNCSICIVVFPRRRQWAATGEINCSFVNVHIIVVDCKIIKFQSEDFCFIGFRSYDVKLCLCNWGNCDVKINMQDR